jgi:YD repeat-containing protein
VPVLSVQAQGNQQRQNYHAKDQLILFQTLSVL